MVGDGDRLFEMKVEIKRQEIQPEAHLGVRASVFESVRVGIWGPSRTWSWAPTYLCVCDGVMRVLSIEDALVGGMNWVAPDGMAWMGGPREREREKEIDGQ